MHPITKYSQLIVSRIPSSGTETNFTADMIKDSVESRISHLSYGAFYRVEIREGIGGTERLFSLDQSWMLL